MHPALSNLRVVLIAIVVGSLLNMALIYIGPILIPPPEGVDARSMASLADGMDRMGLEHFLFPFLAHALGTLIAATVVYRFANQHRRLLAYSMGVFFLFGGIAAARMIAAPIWFVVTDLVMAYLPMARLGIALGRKWSGSR